MVTGNKSFQAGILIDNSETTPPEQCHLAVEIMPGDVSGIAWNSTSQSPVLQFHFSSKDTRSALNDFADWFSQRFSGKGLFKQATCSIVSDQFTLVPDQIFDQDNAEQHITGSFSLSGGEQIRSDKLVQVPSHMVYAIDPNILNRVFEVLPYAKVMHAATVLAESALANMKKTLISSRVYDGLMLCVAIKNDQLHVVNAFDFEAHEDAIYHIRFLMDVIRDKDLKCKVSLDGPFGDLNDLKKKANKYFEVQSEFLKNKLGEKFKNEPATRRLANHVYCA